MHVFCLFTASYLRRIMSDMAGGAASHIRCFITQSEASSINKSVVCCVCGRFSLKQQPVTGELHFTEKRDTNIKHAEKTGTEESNCTVPFVGEVRPPRSHCYDVFRPDADRASGE